MTTPDFIKSIHELATRTLTYEGLEETFGTRASISRPLGLDRLGVHLDTLKPGERSSLAHAESREEEMVIILSGTPDAWINGTLHRLKPHDVVVFEPGTGIAHNIINNSDEQVQMLCIGEHVSDNQWVYPQNPERRAFTPDGRWWEDHPQHTMDDAPSTPE